MFTNPLQWYDILVCHLLAICWIYHVFLDYFLDAFHCDNIPSTGQWHMYSLQVYNEAYNCNMLNLLLVIM